MLDSKSSWIQNHAFASRLPAVLDLDLDLGCDLVSSAIPGAKCPFVLPVALALWGLRGPWLGRVEPWRRGVGISPLANHLETDTSAQALRPAAPAFFWVLGDAAGRSLLHRCPSPPLNTSGLAERPGTFQNIKRKRKPLGCGERGLALQASSRQLVALRPSNYVCTCCRNGLRY